MSPWAVYIKRGKRMGGVGLWPVRQSQLKGFEDGADATSPGRFVPISYGVGKEGTFPVPL